MLRMKYIDMAIYIHKLSHLMTINIMYNYYSFYYHILIPAIIYRFPLPFILSHYWLLF